MVSIPWIMYGSADFFGKPIEYFFSDWLISGGVRRVSKKGMIKSEHFAKKIIKLDAEEGLTVAELYKAADMAKRISDNSTIEADSIEKTVFPSQHICACDGKGLFGN